MRLIKPNWPAPSGVMAFSTTREGGVSSGTYGSLNIAQHVGDVPGFVVSNRSLMAGELPSGTSIQWLNQKHGCMVIEAGDEGKLPVADASWSSSPGVACTVMTADCLPVLLCSQADGSDDCHVAAVHAGWRGLANGVLDRCVTEMAVNPGELMAWMGPAIGPDAFEVGEDVKEQFLSHATDRDHIAVLRCFQPQQGRPGYFLADLYTLAKIRLNALGITSIYGGGFCTFNDPARFYSYRRDGVTGRMATVIAISPT